MEPSINKIDYYTNIAVCNAVDKITSGKGDRGSIEENINETDNKITGLEAVKAGIFHVGHILRHIVKFFLSTEYREKFEKAFEAKPIELASKPTQKTAEAVHTAASSTSVVAARPPTTTTNMTPPETRPPMPTTPAPKAPQEGVIEEGAVLTTPAPTSTVLPPSVGVVHPKRDGEEQDLNTADTVALDEEEDKGKGELGGPIEVATPAPLAEPERVVIDPNKIPKDKNHEVKRAISNIREQVKQIRGAERQNLSEETFYLTRKAFIKIELDKVVKIIKGINEYKDLDIKTEDMIKLYKEIDKSLPDDTPSLKTDQFYEKTEGIFKELL